MVLENKMLNEAFDFVGKLRYPDESHPTSHLILASSFFFPKQIHILLPWYQRQSRKIIEKRIHSFAFFFFSQSKICLSNLFDRVLHGRFFHRNQQINKNDVKIVLKFSKRDKITMIGDHTHSYATLETSEALFEKSRSTYQSVSPPTRYA